MNNAVKRFDWRGANGRLTYAEVVRSAFGAGTASDEEVLQYLVPPMQSLESIQIEITSWCNLSCQQCGRTKALAQGKWTNAHISLDKYRNIVAKLPATRRIFLQGIGEPSLHPNFVELIELASASGKFESIHFNTNGQTHNDDYWRALGRFPRLVVALSVDSLTPDIAELCRSGTKVDMLWDRLKLFRETFPHFVVALVASRLNLDDIENTLQRIAELGGVAVQITRMMSDDVSVILQPEHEVWLADGLRDIRRRYPHFNVFFNANNSGFAPNEKRCVAPFLSPFIMVDGHLTPCCAAVDAAYYKNLRVDDDRDWNAIRSDPRVTGWVRSFVVDDPEVCQGCSLNPNRSKLTKPQGVR